MIHSQQIRFGFAGTSPFLEGKLKGVTVRIIERTASTRSRYLLAFVDAEQYTHQDCETFGDALRAIDAFFCLRKGEQPEADIVHFLSPVGEFQPDGDVPDVTREQLRDAVVAHHSPPIKEAP